MENRLKAIIERIKKQLLEDGYTPKEIFTSSPKGYGDVNSYFEVLVDRKLEGLSEPSAEEVWENMRQQINHLNSLVAHADKEYRKLQNEYRGLKQDYEELVKQK